ncbi:MAG: type II secretion system protein [Phycisphaerales bacterium]
MTSPRSRAAVRARRSFRGRGFTLIEALVVVAVLSVLTGVLVPALGSALRATRTARCMAQVKSLQQETAVWSTSNKDDLPGINTTGRPFLRFPDFTDLCGTTTQTTPTSVWDWISPVAGATHNLSANRAKRTAEIFDRLACPESAGMNDALYGPANVPDFADFDAIHRASGFRQISYLSPASFHLLGKRESGGNPWAAPSGGWHYPYSGPVITPGGYKPKMYTVGAPATKIWVADGTRYVAAPDLLDFDIHPRPQFYGSFTTSGPIYVGSTAYGQDPSQVEFAGGSANGERALPRSVYPYNARKSFRHNGKIHAAYFDGHVGSLTEVEARTDATPWYPTGSVYTGVRATADSFANHAEGDVLQ